ncbi:MAG: MerR family transcriptional regulator [Nocardioides sp.]
MDDDGLLTIGAFARAVELSPSALRYYDDCGLLAPAEVDRSTGYRYYTPELETRARLIRWMRDVGVPVETMRAVLDGGADDARAALSAFATDRAEHAARAAAVVADVLRELERADEASRPASFVVDGPELATALRQVRVAADNDVSSPLACLLVELDGTRLDVVATNRYWLAWRELTVAAPAPGRTPRAARAVLSPGGVLDLLDRLDASADVAVVLAEGRLTLEEPGLADGGVEVETRAVAYPAHRMILADLDEPASRATVDRAELREALLASSRVVAEVEVDPVDRSVRLTTGDRVRLAAGVRGGPARLLLSVPLWLRAVESCLGPEITLDVREPHRPITVRSAYQPSFAALVMPTAEPSRDGEA